MPVAARPSTVTQRVGDRRSSRSCAPAARSIQPRRPAAAGGGSEPGDVQIAAAERGDRVGRDEQQRLGARRACARLTSSRGDRQQLVPEDFARRGRASTARKSRRASQSKCGPMPRRRRTRRTRLSSERAAGTSVRAVRSRATGAGRGRPVVETTDARSSSARSVEVACPTRCIASQNSSWARRRQGERPRRQQSSAISMASRRVDVGDRERQQRRLRGSPASARRGRVLRRTSGGDDDRVRAHVSATSCSSTWRDPAAGSTDCRPGSAAPGRR